MHRFIKHKLGRKKYINTVYTYIVIYIPVSQQKEKKKAKVYLELGFEMPEKLLCSL